MAEGEKKQSGAHILELYELNFLFNLSYLDYVYSFLTGSLDTAFRESACTSLVPTGEIHARGLFKHAQTSGSS